MPGSGRQGPPVDYSILAAMPARIEQLLYAGTGIAPWPSLTAATAAIRSVIITITPLRGSVNWTA
jgi:hypothetical protein